MERFNKSQGKRDAAALQAFALAISALSVKQLNKISMPEALLKALLAYKKIPDHRAIPRQLKYISKLMREMGQEELQRTFSNIPNLKVK